jgi:hypothetical protein
VKVKLNLVKEILNRKGVVILEGSISNTGPQNFISEGITEMSPPFPSSDLFWKPLLKDTVQDISNSLHFQALFDTK